MTNRIKNPATIAAALFAVAFFVSPAFACGEPGSDATPAVLRLEVNRVVDGGGADGGQQIHIGLAGVSGGVTCTSSDNQSLGIFEPDVGGGSWDASSGDLSTELTNLASCLSDGGFVSAVVNDGYIDITTSATGSAQNGDYPTSGTYGEANFLFSGGVPDWVTWHQLPSNDVCSTQYCNFTGGSDAVAPGDACVAPGPPPAECSHEYIDSATDPAATAQWCQLQEQQKQGEKNSWATIIGAYVVTLAGGLAFWWKIV